MCTYLNHTCTFKLLTLTNSNTPGAGRMVNQRRLALPNPHLTEVTEDFLYHLGLTTHDNLTDMFKDVKVGVFSFRTLQVFVIKVV